MYLKFNISKLKIKEKITGNARYIKILIGLNNMFIRYIPSICP